MIKEVKKTERIVLKIPKSIADYFRATFPHGKRTKFFVNCILEYKHKEEINKIEKQLRKVSKKRNKILAYD
jgi:hypothetical protein